MCHLCFAQGHVSLDALALLLEPAWWQLIFPFWRDTLCGFYLESIARGVLFGYWFCRIC